MFELRIWSPFLTYLLDILTYTQSPDYRPDIDSLSPVQVRRVVSLLSPHTDIIQSVVMDTLARVELRGQGVISLVLRDLSEYVSLPFLAAFDAPDTNTSKATSARPSGPRKRITYIALSKKGMPMLVDLYTQFKEQLDIYNDGTIEAILSVRYSCLVVLYFVADNCVVVLDTYKIEIRLSSSV
jgi:hypothetical protein